MKDKPSNFYRKRGLRASLLRGNNDVPTPREEYNFVRRHIKGPVNAFLATVNINERQFSDMINSAIWAGYFTAGKADLSSKATVHDWIISGEFGVSVWGRNSFNDKMFLRKVSVEIAVGHIVFAIARYFRVRYRAEIQRRRSLCRR